MIDNEKIFQKYKNYPIAMYGLSTETEKMLHVLNEYNIIGLLDSFQTEGYLYEKNIISLNDCLDKKVKLIIVVARPGSCKAIARKIGDFCKNNKISLIDYNGNNLLSSKPTLFKLSSLGLITKSDALAICNNYELISFDLFDTLAMRKVLYSSDILIRMDQKLNNQNIVIENFIDKRVAAEKKLSVDHAPTLDKIYAELLVREKISTSLASEFAKWEWELDYETIIPRYDVIEIINYLCNTHKRVCIVSDTYYSKQQIRLILEKIGIDHNIELYISCEHNTSKTQNLFSIVRKNNEGFLHLHIGDDDIADIEGARKAQISSLKLMSAADILDHLGYMGLEKYTETYNDRLKLGLFASVLFNSPFLPDNNSEDISINNAKVFGYCITGAIITDFVFWFYNKTTQKGIKNIWFGARDGYLIRKLYQRLVLDNKSAYLLISRISALRIGIFCKKDIEYITDMKYSGSEKSQYNVRFGISIDEHSQNQDKVISNILSKSRDSRKNFLKYLSTINIDDSEIAFFDFVAKGTVQMFCQKLIENKIIGLYFLKLPNDSELASELEIDSFIDTNSRHNSSIYNDYYILETILTSPQPSVIDYAENGDPIYAKECRTNKEIECVLNIQDGISDFFDDYISLCNHLDNNSHSDIGEAILNLVHKIKLGTSITEMKVEDSFFNRTTNYSDLL